ncbi:MAG TPA: amidohydrolase family protein [Ilumatobacteraceae bacterium]|nr:amidohydrolase family protein [Ilumatobacteraceae bacterium]
MASQKPMHGAHRLAYDGAVDADGHILEPPDLWETYIDPQFRDRALRIVIDENGLEELEIDGKRSQMARKGFPSTLGAMGDPDLRSMQFDPERTYLRESPYGAMDPNERLDVLDAENIDIAILYTTVGLLWEAELEDPELSQAYTRAYNRWICEFCADSPRLVPTAHLSLTDPVAAAEELERAVGEGAKGAYVAPFNHNGRPLGHPDNNPVFAAAQDLGVPFAIHPTFEPQWTKGTRMGSWENVKQLRLLASVQASDGVRHQFTTLFDYGVFDQFPTLKVLVLESGGGWIGYWLDRIDAVYGHTFIGQRVPLDHKPSDYFRERVWISCDPDERTIPALAERFGVERFMWASDFPHADHTPEYVDDLDELASAFSESDRAKFLGDNARQLFDLPAGRP